MMEKGFIVEYVDGKIVTEDQMDWKLVPKANIKCLKLKWFNKEWSVPGPNCFQRKRGSASPFERGHRLEFRVIGYFDGPNKVIYMVNENTGVMTMVVEPVK